MSNYRPKGSDPTHAAREPGSNTDNRFPPTEWRINRLENQVQDINRLIFFSARFADQQGRKCPKNIAGKAWADTTLTWSRDKPIKFNSDKQMAEIVLPWLSKTSDVTPGGKLSAVDHRRLMVERVVMMLCSAALFALCLYLLSPKRLYEGALRRPLGF